MGLRAAGIRISALRERLAAFDRSILFASSGGVAAKTSCLSLPPTLEAPRHQPDPDLQLLLRLTPTLVRVHPLDDYGRPAHPGPALADVDLGPDAL